MEKLEYCLHEIQTPHSDSVKGEHTSPINMCSNGAQLSGEPGRRVLEGSQNLAGVGWGAEYFNSPLQDPTKRSQEGSVRNGRGVIISPYTGVTPYSVCLPYSVSPL